MGNAFHYGAFHIVAAENIFRMRWLSVLVQSWFTFLRAVPTPVWVLLMMVCLGMGPAAGIAGLCVHTTAFFTRAFAQSFESIPQETIEALEATGVGRIARRALKASRRKLSKRWRQQALAE